MLDCFTNICLCAKGEYCGIALSNCGWLSCSITVRQFSTSVETFQGSLVRRPHIDTVFGNYYDAFIYLIGTTEGCAIRIGCVFEIVEEDQGKQLCFSNSHFMSHVSLFINEG